MTIESILGVDWPQWPTLVAVLLAVVVVLGIVMAAAGKEMTARGGPGIVAFELSRSKEQTESIFIAWGTAGKRAAMLSLCIDYIWILFYATALALSALYVSEVAASLGWQIVGFTGRIIGALSLAAGALDMVENSVLLSQLVKGAGELRTQISFVAASAKFALVGFAIAYVVGIRSVEWLFGA